jgi:hypothetical protein
VALGVVGDLEAGLVELADLLPGEIEALALQEAQALGDEKRGTEAELLQDRRDECVIGLVSVIERQDRVSGRAVILDSQHGRNSWSPSSVTSHSDGT